MQQNGINISSGYRGLLLKKTNLFKKNILEDVLPGAIVNGI